MAIYLFLWSDTKYNLINSKNEYSVNFFVILLDLFNKDFPKQRNVNIPNVPEKYIAIVFIKLYFVSLHKNKIFNILGLNLYIVLFISVIAAFIATYITCILVSKVPILEFLFGFRRKSYLLELAVYDSEKQAEQEKAQETIVQAKPKTKNHTVKKGETLSSIARTYQTTIKNLKELNNIKDIDYI